MSDVVMPEIEHESMVVLYEPRTGRIVHRHEVVSMRGAEHPDERTREADAREQLRLAQPDAEARVSAVEALHVEPSHWQADRYYRVDPKKRALVEEKQGGRVARPKRPG